MNAPLPLAATHASIAEIAQALGVSKQAAQKRANKEKWPAEKAGRGMAYPLATLPTDVRKAVEHLRAVKQPVENPTPLQKAMRNLTHTLLDMAANEEAEAKARQERAEAFLLEQTGMSDNEAFSLKAHCEIAEGWKVWFVKRQPMKRSHSWEPYATAYKQEEDRYRRRCVRLTPSFRPALCSAGWGNMSAAISQR